MADKSVGELIAAKSVTPTDLFVLEQNGTAKKLTGQILENWLVSFADGHGGIQSIKKLSTSGLADTYRITLADTTTFDFVVNNGRGITGISKTATSGLADTYTISYNNGTTSTFTVTNGAKGDKGDNAYIWIKYASQEPMESSHSMGDIPDNWIGIYSGNASSAPSDWKQYKWFKHKGEKGDTGSPATLLTKSVTYQVSDSGTIIPSGAWGSSIPVVAQGKYLWTKTELQFNSGDPIVSYSVARMGMDGTGSVSSVNNVSPGETGNVTLTADDVGALPSAGGDMTGAINMNGQSISGLNDPTEESQAARKGYVDAAKTAANAYTDTSVRKAAPRNLLDNSDFRNPVNQRGVTSETDILKYAYFIDRWSNASDTTTKYGLSNQGVTIGSAGIRQTIEGIEAGTVLTAAVKYGGNIICVTGTIEYNGTSYKGIASYNDGTAKVFIFTQSGNAGIMCQASTSNSSITVEWAALYKGSYTTETLPEYQPKGYGAELAECQRYFMRYGGNYAFIAVGNVETAALAQCIIQLPVDMRLPTASVNIKPDLSKFRIKNGTVSVTISEINIYQRGHIVSLACTISSTFTPGGSCLLTTIAGDNFIELSADL